MRAGAELLEDYELLELLLFYSIERIDTKPLAKRLLDRFGTLGDVFAAESAAAARVRHRPAHPRAVQGVPRSRPAARRAQGQGHAGADQLTGVTPNSRATMAAMTATSTTRRYCMKATSRGSAP